MLFPTKNDQCVCLNGQHYLLFLFISRANSTYSLSIAYPSAYPSKPGKGTLLADVRLDYRSPFAIPPAKAAHGWK